MNPHIAVDVIPACPVCGHTDIEGGSVEVDGATAKQECGCVNCGSSWTDVYVLADRYGISQRSRYGISQRSL